METDGIEKEILDFIGKQLLAKKEELVRLIDGKVEDPVVKVEIITRELMNKGFISSVSPIGETCYAITKKGIQFLNMKG